MKAPMPVGPTGFVVFKQTDPDKRAAAMDFVRWLNSPEFQRVNAANAKQFPTRKSTGNPLENDANCPSPSPKKKSLFLMIGPPKRAPY